MKRLVCLVVLLLVVLATAPASAAGSGARARLEQFAKGLHSLSGDFQQRVVNANGQQVQTSRGTVALEAPRQFRWQTTAPYKQLIIADGSHVWMYDPDLDQVTVHQQGPAQAQSPLTVLTNVSRVDEDFAVHDIGVRDGLDWLRLVPKRPHARFEYVELGLDADGLRDMTFKDRLGSVTHIRFSHWKRNARLPASTFHFTPPKGAAVIGDAASVPKIQPLRQ